MVSHGTNMPLPIGGGTLTLCGLDDFRDTLRGYHEVVTLCRYEPQYPEGSANKSYHSYFRAFHDSELKWRNAIDLVEIFFHRERMCCFIVFMAVTGLVV